MKIQRSQQEILLSAAETTTPVDSLRDEALSALETANSPEQLEQWRVEFMGRKGKTGRSHRGQIDWQPSDRLGCIGMEPAGCLRLRDQVDQASDIFNGACLAADKSCSQQPPEIAGSFLRPRFVGLG